MIVRRCFACSASCALKGSAVQAESRFKVRLPVSDARQHYRDFDRRAGQGPELGAKILVTTQIPYSTIFISTFSISTTISLNLFLNGP